MILLKDNSEIRNMYLGKDYIHRIYQNGECIYYTRLPDRYTELEYLQNFDKALCETGIKLGDRVEIDAQFTQTNDTSFVQMLIGLTANSGSYMGILKSNTLDAGQFSAGYSSTPTQIISSNVDSEETDEETGVITQIRTDVVELYRVVYGGSPFQLTMTSDSAVARHTYHFQRSSDKTVNVFTFGYDDTTMTRECFTGYRQQQRQIQKVSTPIYEEQEVTDEETGETTTETVLTGYNDVETILSSEWTSEEYIKNKYISWALQIIYANYQAKGWDKYALFGLPDCGGLNPNNWPALEAKIYSAKAYDENTDELIGYYVPCINPQGVAGFFDVIGRKFYPNSYSTGHFSGKMLRPDKLADYLEPVTDETILYLEDDQKTELTDEQLNQIINKGYTIS